MQERLIKFDKQVWVAFGELRYPSGGFAYSKLVIISSICLVIILLSLALALHRLRRVKGAAENPRKEMIDFFSP